MKSLNDGTAIGNPPDAVKKDEVLFTTEEENLKNRIRYLEGELMAIKEKVKVLAKLPPFTIRIDAQTKQVAEDILSYISEIKGMGKFA